jgi:hypothetical protein
MSVVSCGQHETAWNCMKQHGIFSCCMELHETAWNFFHAAWNCMKQHGITWKKSMQHEKSSTLAAVAQRVF